MMPTNTMPPVDGATLARLLGVGPKEIYDLTRDGVLTRGAGRLFEVEDNVRRYCAKPRHG
jgi:hypothetical protein